MKKISIVFILMLLSFGLLGCNNEVNNPEVITERVEASDFVLEVTTPTVVEEGNILKVKGTLTYIGDKTINLFHGGPIIRFTFTGSNETRAYEDRGYITELKTGQTIEIEDEFQASKTGRQSLVARTTLLKVNGELIEGIGNEKYIKENKNERILELKKSKITLEPIEIVVK
jgi:uncharacterized lipoprotein NlpE involved in copper resistance